MENIKGNIDKKVFRVPDDYFENMTSEVMNRIDTRENRGAKVIAMLKPQLMLAASMILLVIISYSLLKIVLPDMGLKDIDVNIEEITAYLVEEADESIISAEAAISPGYRYDSYEMDLPDEEIIEFLMDEKVDYNDIIEIF